jgi:hypothetical protein
MARPPINIRPSPELLKARKREIARRYARKYRKNAIPLTFAAIRVAELTRLYEYRYGPGPLPDHEDSITRARVMVHHLGRLWDGTRRVATWLDRNAPWLGVRSQEQLIRDTQERPLRWRADRLAWKLQVTAAERHTLNLRTIGAIDQTKEQRADIAKQRKRERDQQRRRADGIKPRAQYEAAAITTTKPWITQGISRRTWYRRRLAQVRAAHISLIDI